MGFIFGYHQRNKIVLLREKFSAKGHVLGEGFKEETQMDSLGPHNGVAASWILPIVWWIKINTDDVVNPFRA